MKPETQRGLLQEIIYLLVVVLIVSTLQKTGLIDKEDSWLYISFFVCWVAPLRQGYFIDFRSFSWKKWKLYLLNTVLLIAVLFLIDHFLF